MPKGAWVTHRVRMWRAKDVAGTVMAGKGRKVLAKS